MSTSYAELIERLRSVADFNQPSFAVICEAADALEDLRISVIAFGAPHAVRYAEDFGLKPGELHPRHYDILERCGARMVDFRRADENVLSRERLDPRQMRDEEVRAVGPADRSPESGEQPAQDKRD